MAMVRHNEQLECTVIDGACQIFIVNDFFVNLVRGVKMRKILLMLLVCATNTVIANSACDTPRDDFDGLYCLNKVYQEADKELNVNYKKLSSKLDRESKKLLKAGQLSWIDNRNSSCSMREAGGFYVNLSCATETTISRSYFLQDRIRECVSSGCQTSKL